MIVSIQRDTVYWYTCNNLREAIAYIRWHFAKNGQYTEPCDYEIWSDEKWQRYVDNVADYENPYRLIPIRLALAGTAFGETAYEIAAYY